MEIRQNISLKSYNTFGIDAIARYFIEVSSVDLLCEALKLEGYPPIFVLSGGSNVLLTGDLEALVLHINIKGIHILEESGENVSLRVMAGENWHGLVQWALGRGFGGLENLSLIPGNTGTAPIQNIGAYGVEIKDVFLSCLAMEIETGKLVPFSPADCSFGYRDSFFKNEGKGKYIITSVDLRLTRNRHRLNTSYGAIEAELKNRGQSNPGIAEVSEAVIAIRRSKLPDPEILGNSGSFFKNPVVTAEDYERLAKLHPGLPSYRVSDSAYKLPAGWLIEQCGYKGKRYGDAGVHHKQALVLVNYGNATGEEILKLANEIRQTVSERFGVGIEPEVNIIGKNPQ